MATPAKFEAAWAELFTDRSQWKEALLHLNNLKNPDTKTSVTIANHYRSLGDAPNEIKALTKALAQNDKEFPDSAHVWNNLYKGNVDTLWCDNTILINRRLANLHWHSAREYITGLIYCVRTLELACRRLNSPCVDAMADALSDMLNMLETAKLSPKEVRELFGLTQSALPNEHAKRPWSWIGSSHSTAQTNMQIGALWVKLKKIIYNGSGGDMVIDMLSALDESKQFRSKCQYPEMRHYNTIRAVGSCSDDKIHLLNRLAGADVFDVKFDTVEVVAKHVPEVTGVLLVIRYVHDKEALKRLLGLPYKKDEEPETKRRRVQILRGLGVSCEVGGTTGLEDLIADSTRQHMQTATIESSHDSLRDAKNVVSSYRNSILGPLIARVEFHSSTFKGLAASTELVNCPRDYVIASGTPITAWLFTDDETKYTIRGGGGGTAHCISRPTENKFPQTGDGMRVVCVNSTPGKEDTGADGAPCIERWAGYYGLRMYLGLPMT